MYIRKIDEVTYVTVKARLIGKAALFLCII